MKTFVKFMTTSGLILSMWSLAQAQPHTSTITSRNGNSACHQPNRLYTFDFRVTTTPDQTRLDPLGNRITDTYTVKLVTISDGNNRNSIIDNNLARYNSKDFVEVDRGDVGINYLESWREETITVNLVARIEHKEKKELKTEDGFGPPTYRTIGTEDINNSATFALGAFLTDPQTILINGVPQSTFEIDPAQGCQTYTLSAGTVEGVDRYRWVVSPSSILVSSPGSLTTSTIQVQPTFGATPSSVRLELIQDCSGPRIKAKDFPVVPTDLVLTSSRSVICDDGIDVSFAVPPVGAGVTADWVIDYSKLDRIFPADANEIILSATGNHSAYTNISVSVNSPCGSISTSKRVFIGTPSMPVTDPSGYPTVQHSYQGFKNYRVISDHSDQAVQQYNWWVSPNTLTLFNSTSPSCIIEGTTQGYHNFYVQLTNACGASPAAGGGIQVGNGGTIPDPKRLENPNLAPAIASLRLQPNPAQQQVQLQLVDAQGGALKVNDLRVEVLDLSGKVVATTSNATLEVDGLATGIYIVRARTGATTLTQKLIVK